MFTSQYCLYENLGAPNFCAGAPKKKVSLEPCCLCLKNLAKTTIKPSKPYIAFRMMKPQVLKYKLVFQVLAYKNTSLQHSMMNNGE